MMRELYPCQMYQMNLNNEDQLFKIDYFISFKLICAMKIQNRKEINNENRESSLTCYLFIWPFEWILL